MTYRVFISHGWHDRWIARQMARLVLEEAKANPFIDIFDVKKGDRIEERIFEERPKCKELVALLTPWSVTRNWVWTEIGAARACDMRIVGVLFGLSLHEIEDKGGLACLNKRNTASLDEFDDYIDELAVRVKGVS